MASSENKMTRLQGVPHRAAGVSRFWGLQPRGTHGEFPEEGRGGQATLGVFLGVGGEGARWLGARGPQILFSNKMGKSEQ